VEELSGPVTIADYAGQSAQLESRLHRVSRAHQHQPRVLNLLRFRY